MLRCKTGRDSRQNSDLRNCSFFGIAKCIGAPYIAFDDLTAKEY